MTQFQKPCSDTFGAFSCLQASSKPSQIQREENEILLMEDVGKALEGQVGWEISF